MAGQKYTPVSDESVEWLLKHGLIEGDVPPNVGTGTVNVENLQNGAENLPQQPGEVDPPASEETVRGQQGPEAQQNPSSPDVEPTDETPQNPDDVKQEMEATLPQQASTEIEAAHEVQQNPEEAPEEQTTPAETQQGERRRKKPKPSEE
ncbi:hypothetical protein [Paenibacillus alkalitolerans]|uniref:hypothetical protein n=1 Tax=Paenibacillus alkalitolerans TaxID=2799335 RepID=UPI0018F4AEBA|nr:hypothetical protein [Paenibacillus alkalitolerans]